MVDNNSNTEGINRLKKFSNFSNDINKCTGSEREERGNSRWVELFFSFDVVNSSLYKTINYYRWSDVLSLLFRELQEKVKGDISDAELWRILGDEMVFVIRLKTIDAIYAYVDDIFFILTDMTNKIKNGNIFNQLSAKCEEKDIEVMKIQNVISLQAAAWIAIITNEGNQERELYDNIFEKYKIKDDYEINEYLGNDIDTGFRIKKRAQDRRLVLSFELAYILSSKTESSSCLNIVAYDKFKGIWNENLYPIIWYHNPKIYNNIAFEDSFYYDEGEHNSIVKEYLTKNRKFDLQDYMYSNVNKALNKILCDRNLMGKIIAIKEQIKKTSSDYNTNNFEPSFLLQLHCVAICCDVENRKILIVKRSHERKKYPDKWDFGCAKAKIDQSLEERIAIEYQQDFNIKIKTIVDKQRIDMEPIPIAVYQIPDGNTGNTHKGIITVAQVLDKENLKLNSQKYADYRWIREEEIEKFQEDTIEDFKDTLKKVFRHFDEYFKGEQG